jgi:farnesyl-diphosphate farnesyltransferase
MAAWALRGDDFPDEAALDAYMFEVAGRVGLLLTDLFAEHSPRIAGRREELMETAVSFGLGLQTVNVIRGLHEDPARGWTYIPRSLVGGGNRGSRMGSSLESSSTRSGPPARLDARTLPEEDRDRILDFLVRKAGRHITDALAYCRAIPRRERGIRIFCIIPALLAAETARRSVGNLDVFQGPVKVGREDVRGLVLKTRLLYFSDGWVGRERRRALALAEGRG